MFDDTEQTRTLLMRPIYSTTGDADQGIRAPGALLPLQTHQTHASQFQPYLPHPKKAHFMPPRTRTCMSSLSQARKSAQTHASCHPTHVEHAVPGPAEQRDFVTGRASAVPPLLGGHGVRAGRSYAPQPEGLLGTAGGEASGGQRLHQSHR